MRIIEVPEGRYCTDGETFRCKFLDDDFLDWCNLDQRDIEDFRKCAPCAHPEV